VRIYADTTHPDEHARRPTPQRVLGRKKGLTFIKFDLGVHELEDPPTAW
jgi:hypothetical protein